MHYVVFDQLSKCKVAHLPPYTIETMHMVIPKQGATKHAISVNKTYIIQVEPYIVKPFDGFTLHDNWNNGTHPTSYILKATIKKQMGKMTYIESVGYNMSLNVETNDKWDGWVPTSSMKILEEV